MKRFSKKDRTVWVSRIPNLKGVKFRKEGMDVNGNRISSTDNEDFGAYAGWRKHKKDGRYYGQDLYYDTAGDYCKDFKNSNLTTESQINRLVERCVRKVLHESIEQDNEYASHLINIWMNNERTLYDKKMAIVKMLAKKPNLDANVLAQSSMLAQFYRDVVNTAKKNGDTINGNRSVLLLRLANDLIDEVDEYKAYE